MLRLDVAFDVTLVDTFTDVIIVGLNVYLDGFELNRHRLAEEITINSHRHNFTQTLNMTIWKAESKS
jgi:hypothetical protein